jgi:hypothetical protein
MGTEVKESAPCRMLKESASAGRRARVIVTGDEQS